MRTLGRLGAISFFRVILAAWATSWVSRTAVSTRSAEATGANCSWDGPLLKLGQIEKIVEGFQKTIGILACGGDQVGLLLVSKGPTVFFMEEIERHADAGQRRFQFVADGGDEVAFDVIEQKHASDVLEDHGHAKTSRLSSRSRTIRGRK